MPLSTLFLLLAACPAGSPDTQPADTETGGTETGGTPEQCPPADSGAVEDCVPQGDTEVCNNGIDDDCDGSANECGWSGVFSIDEVALIIAAETEQDLAGSAVGAAGDVDCDGVDDFLVGADHAGDEALGPGAAYVMRGGPEIGDNLGQAWATIRGTSDEHADFGNRLQGIGDVDGDGRGDIAVAGDSAHVFLDLQPGESFDTDANAVFTGAEPYGTWTTFDSVGDLTGDGRLDLSLFVAGGETGAHFYGNVICDAQLSGNVTTDDCLARIEAPGVHSPFAGTGDFDGDGQADLLVRDPSYCPDCENPNTDVRGAAFGMFGPIVGDRSWDDPDFLWTGDLGDSAGSAAAALGDTNADGYDDIAVTTSDQTDGTPAGIPDGINIVLGPFSGTRSLWDADAVLDSWSACLAGADIDGDGRADVVVSSIYDGELIGSAVAIHHGPLSGTTDEASFDATFVATVAEETEMQTAFGRTCATGGDVNADGHGDLLFGDSAAGLSELAGGSASPYATGQTYLLFGNGR